VSARGCALASWLVGVALACSDGGSEDGAVRDAGARARRDGGAANADAARLRAEAEFWQNFAVCGEWAEYFPTLEAMAQGADAVVLGRIADVKLGNTVRGDAAEDFYAETNLQIEVVES
jgi:hypothetical protein